MKLKIFSVFDTKAEAYLTPFFCPSTGVAIRSFEAAANDATHQFRLYAADFTLFELGTYEQSTAKFEILPAPMNLGSALTFRHSDATPDERQVAAFTQENN